MRETWSHLNVDELKPVQRERLKMEEEKGKLVEWRR